MRFIHTADWHIGKTIRGIERWDEFRSLLNEIGVFAERHGADLVIIAGDVFDVFSPPAEAENIVFSFLVHMNRIGVPVVIIAGNHDSYQRFDCRTELFAIANVFVIGRPRKEGFFKFTTKRGEKVIVGALPFVSERHLTKGSEIFEKTWGEIKGTYADKIGAMIRILSEHFEPDAVNILAAHILLEGAVTSGTERQMDISNSFAVLPPSIPAAATYTALGHIHKHQQIIRASAPTYYSGSIMKMDFGEENDEKGFMFVEASPRIPPQVEFIKLESVQPLVTVNVDFKDLEQEAQEIGKQIGNGYGRLLVKNDKPVFGLGELIKRLIPNAIDWGITASEPHVKEKKLRNLNEISNPIEMYKAFYEEANGGPPSEEMLEALNKLYMEALDAADQA